MQISSTLPSLAAFGAAGARPVDPRIPFDIASARADSAEDRRRLEENEARHAGAIANFASQGITMSQGSYSMLYKQELAQSVDADGNGTIGVEELAAGLGGDQNLERAGRLHALLDIDGDGSLGLEEFGDSVRDPFRDADFRRQLEQRGPMDPAAMGALHRRHAAQYDPAAVLGAMMCAVDTVA